MKKSKATNAHKNARRSDSHDEEVGRRVRARRSECRLSQTELADKIGVTFQQVQKYEKGVNRMGASRLARIAEALDVPITYFFDGAATAKRSPDTQPASVLASMEASGALRFVKAFQRIKTRKTRQILVQLCETFAEAR